MQFIRNTLETTGSYHSFTEHEFLTDDGFKAYALKYTQNFQEISQFHFFVDATSSQYKGLSWFLIEINFSSTSVPGFTPGISYEEALSIIQSISVDGDSSPHEKNETNEETIALAESIKATEIFEAWFSSAWFGQFFESSLGWIFHYDLGWLFYKTSKNDGDWYWSDKKGWIWTKENIYPYFFSDNTDDWIFFDSEKSKAYNFQNKEWKDWNELELVVQSKEKKLQQAIGNATTTDEGIINIINSNLSESEKLDGIAEMIFYGL
jgi:hypothetical protein